VDVGSVGRREMHIGFCGKARKKDTKKKKKK
jgi:hypothetical protein